MKKRLLSILLTLILCITMLPNVPVLAAERVETKAYAVTQNYSKWAMNDLIVGDTYGIYPMSWYNSDLTKAITKGMLRNLIGGLTIKIENTDCASINKDKVFRLKEKLTVKEVMKTLYEVASNHTYQPDLGLRKINYMKFMKDNGIYTGKNGEQALTEVCSIEQACVIATRLVTCLYDKVDAASKGFFYQTEANGNKVYMLGSIHMADNDTYPINSAIWKAYQSSDALAVEVNILEQTGVSDYLTFAMYNDGTTLKDHVSKETYEKTIKLAASLGYPEAQIAMCKPWYLYTSFVSLATTNSATTQEANQGKVLGIDMSFLTSASISGKPILEVEGYSTQGKMLDSFSDQLEELLLNSTLDSINQIKTGTGAGSADSLDDMLELWCEGDEEKYKKYTSFEYANKDLLQDESAKTEQELMKEFKEKLFTNRDKNMADYIDKLLSSSEKKTYFVVVGSGHYVSDYDVIDILTEKGYKITQIK